MRSGPEHAPPTKRDRLGATIVQDIVTDIGEARDPGLGEDLAPAGEKGVVEAEVAATPDDAHRMRAERRKPLLDLAERGVADVVRMQRNILHKRIYGHAMGPRIVREEITPALIGGKAPTMCGAEAMK